MGQSTVRKTLIAGYSYGNKHLIESLGSRLIYLPPYSPDLKPIEHVWANLKALIRTHKHRQDNLSLAIADCIS